MWNVSGTNENQLAFVEAGGGVILLTWRSGCGSSRASLGALGNLGAVGEPTKNR
jgi:hypothetical protein